MTVSKAKARHRSCTEAIWDLGWDVMIMKLRVDEVNRAQDDDDRVQILCTV